MTDEKEIRNAIGRYLEKIAAELGDVPAQDKDAILTDVEAHIYEALKQRAGEDATLGDLEAVLAQMAPPSSYATNGAGDGCAAETRPRFAKLPIIAACLAPFGFIMILSGMSNGMNPWPASASWIWYIVLPLGVASPFAVTVLGFLSISKIRASKGRLIGMPLAVAATIFYPIVISNAALAAVFEPMGRRALAIFIVIMIPCDIALAIYVRRRATRPLKPGEFA